MINLKPCWHFGRYFWFEAANKVAVISADVPDAGAAFNIRFIFICRRILTLCMSPLCRWLHSRQLAINVFDYRGNLCRGLTSSDLESVNPTNCIYCAKTCDADRDWRDNIAGSVVERPLRRTLVAVKGCGRDGGWCWEDVSDLAAEGVDLHPTGAAC